VRSKLIKAYSVLLSDSFTPRVPALQSPVGSTPQRAAEKSGRQTGLKTNRSQTRKASQTGGSVPGRQKAKPE